MTWTSTSRRHVQAVSAFVRAGFDEVYVNQIGRGQQGFFTFYRKQVLPRLDGD